MRLLGIGTAGAMTGCVGTQNDENQNKGTQDRTEQDETDQDDNTTDMTEQEGLVTVTAEKETVEESVGRIKNDIEANENLSLVTELNHSENAATVDQNLPPTVVLMFGNPAAGTPLMQEARTIGVDLPQKILVWENDDGEVMLTYNDPTHVAERHGIEGQDELLENIRGALDTLAAGEM